ncbi:MAG: hypothetical protein R3F59_24450 [Myxococcota bacterium]
MRSRSGAPTRRGSTTTPTTCSTTATSTCWPACRCTTRARRARRSATSSSTTRTASATRCPSRSRSARTRPRCSTATSSPGAARPSTARSATDAGIAYTILLRTWSTPLDDDRLSFGFFIANGSCNDIREVYGRGTSSALQDECIIQGESLTPKGNEIGPFYGWDAVNDAGRIWEGSVEFEADFCNPDRRMGAFCNDENDQKIENGDTCSWGDPPTGSGDRCYCGNPENVPTPGG